jgi:hypothetical protein
MDITPYVERLRASLTVAAATGGPEIRDAADRLGAALDPATRLGLMEALSDAASELSTQLPDTTIRVVLDGRDLDFVVEYDDAANDDDPAPAPASADAEDDDESVARLTLRLPESVKARAEELAATAGISLNSWVVTALRDATSADGLDFDLPGFGYGRGRRGGPGRPDGGMGGGMGGGRGGRGGGRPGGRPDPRRETGWV